MKLINILAIVATMINTGDIFNISEVKPEEIARIAADIFVERKGETLEFKKISESQAQITESLLSKEVRVAPFIVFTCYYNRWWAEQFNTEFDFDRYLTCNQTTQSARIAIIGANKLLNFDCYTMETTTDRGTSIVILSELPVPSSLSTNEGKVNDVA